MADILQNIFWMRFMINNEKLQLLGIVAETFATGGM